jgi:hypothetical protein
MVAVASPNDSTNLNRWKFEWTGESLKQVYFGYVLPFRCQDGTHAILKLTPVPQEAKEQVVALSIWVGDGAPRLLAESCDEHRRKPADRPDQTRSGAVASR